MKKFILPLLALVLVSCSHETQLTQKPQSSLLSEERYVSTIPSRELNLKASLTRIAFGSCANQDAPQPIWNSVAAAKPDLFLFTGDNIYGSGAPQQPLPEQYRKLDLIPEYLKVRETIPFMATWDDHDFGQKDGGADWEGKVSARKDFMNYWTYAANSIPLDRDGVYHSQIIGPQKQAVQIIMLDTRYNRSPLIETPGKEKQGIDYLPSNEGTILGEQQWQWLSKELQRPAKLRFIISSIQLIPAEPRYEKWANFPKERQRFFDLIANSKVKNVILISGDRHIGSISKIDLPKYGPLYEVTASSINRPNNYSDFDSHYLGASYNKENFGLASIDWKMKTITLDLRGLNNQVVNLVKIPLQ